MGRKISELLKKKLRQLPDKPGVYIMRDQTGSAIYVGKSRRLSRRVRSYFVRKHDSPKIGALVVAIADLEFIVTENEVEALILENNLIKRYKPRYNTMLKDSKTHPYLKVGSSAMFPRLTRVRKVCFGDGNKYFGPFPSESDLSKIIGLLCSAFHLCQGKNQLTLGKSSNKPCLLFHMHQCMGACVGKVSPEEYGRAIDEVVSILEGKSMPDYERMEHEMATLAAEFRFEEAAELRDTVRALRTYFSTQNVEFLRSVDTDLWGIAESSDMIIISVFFVRGGKLLGNRTIETNREPNAEVPEILGSLMTRFYDFNLIPGKILTGTAPSPLSSLRDYFATRSGHAVRFAQPKRGQFRRLLAMANENAMEILRNAKSKGNERVAENVLDLEKRLSLPCTPRRIECVDISHIQGTDPVASLVVFVNGKPHRSEYRIFHIKSFLGIDDPFVL